MSDSVASHRIGPIESLICDNFCVSMLNRVGNNFSSLFGCPVCLVCRLVLLSFLCHRYIFCCCCCCAARRPVDLDVVGAAGFALGPEHRSTGRSRVAFDSCRCNMVCLPLHGSAQYYARHQHFIQACTYSIVLAISSISETLMIADGTPTVEYTWPPMAADGTALNPELSPLSIVCREKRDVNMDRLNRWMHLTDLAIAPPGPEQLQYTALDGSEQFDFVKPRDPLGDYTYAFAY